MSEMNNEQQSEATPGNGQEAIEQQQLEQEITGHPAWQGILDSLPTSLHNEVKPTLLEWDKGVQNKIQSTRDEYAAYEDFKKNEIDQETLEQGLWLLQNLQNDPEKIARDIIESWELQDKFNTAPSPVAKADEEDELPDLDGEFDITKHPEFIKMQEVVNSMQTESASAKAAREEAEATAEIDQQLEKLHETYGEFDDMFVLSHMAQGQDGAKAVTQYLDTVNQAAARISGNTQQAPAVTQVQAPAPTRPEPVVMGGNSGAGSGTPAEAVDFAKMKATDRESMVAEILNKRT